MSQNFRLKNNSLFVAAEAVGGFFNADQLRTVALVSESESAVLKVTEDGAIGFMIEESKLTEISDKFRESGILLKHYRSTQVPVARACLGELCPKHEQDALGHSIEVAATMQQAFPDGAPFVRIGMNGCAQNCLASGTDDIHIVGESTGYKIQIGGKASEIPQLAQFLAENVAAEDLGIYLQHILTVYMRECQDGETLHDVVERTGLAPFDRNAALESDSAPVGDGLLDEHPAELDSDTLLDDSESALAEEDNVFLETALDAMAPADLGDSSEDSLELLAMDGSMEGREELAGDLLGESELDVAIEDASETAPAVLEDPSQLESLSGGDISDAILDPSDLDDGLMDLGSMDAAVLADLTMNPHIENDDAAMDATTQDELMDDEISMGTSDATEDDVSRVTQAMRSEAAIEQSMNSDPTSASAGDGLSELNALDIQSQDTSKQEPVDFAEPESKVAPEAFEEHSGAADIPQSFLELQDAAAKNDALQVKLVEEIVSIRTPDGVMLNLPLQSLNAGLRIVLNLGQLPFETYVKDEKIFVRYGQTSLALPLESLAAKKQERPQAASDFLQDAA